MLNNHIQDIGDFLDVDKVAIEPATFTWIDLSFNFFFRDICILFFFQATVIIVTVCDYMATLNKDYFHTAVNISTQLEKIRSFWKN